MSGDFEANDSPRMKDNILNVFTPYQKSRRLAVITGSLLVAMMMACLAAGFALLGSRVVPGWNGSYLVWMALFLSLEAIYSRTRAKDLEDQQKIIFRLSEWVAFAVAIKLLIYLVHGPAQLLEDLPRWQTDFLGSFFTSEYMVALFIAFIIWLSSLSYAQELEDLYTYEQAAGWDEMGKLTNLLRDYRRRIAARTFSLGALVVGLAVFARTDVSGIADSGQPWAAGQDAPVVNVLLYFVLALVLLSQTQFALLRARWHWQRLPISSQIARRWVQFGLIFFAALAVIVFFLPTGYSLGLLDTLRVTFGFLVNVVSFIFLLLMLPFTLCASLFSFSQGPRQPVQQPQMPIPPPVTDAATPPGWLELLRSLLFWIVLLSIIFFALRYYLQQNAALWSAITNFPFFQWVGDAWTSIRKWIKRTNRQVGSFVQMRLKRLRDEGGVNPIRRMQERERLARYSPRKKVIRNYINVIELAGQRGLTRRPAETPLHYEQHLIHDVPEMETEIEAITDVFVEARYSDHQVEEPDAQRAASLWEQIKAYLRQWKRPGA